MGISCTRIAEVPVKPTGSHCTMDFFNKKYAKIKETLGTSLGSHCTISSPFTLVRIGAPLVQPLVRAHAQVEQQKCYRLQSRARCMRSRLGLCCPHLPDIVCRHLQKLERNRVAENPACQAARGFDRLHERTIG